ncbi:WD40-repeat-containing domain protein [Protomyces lactucae-debilis]|uniref:WD40-repeat-containing domain protein n=1 Tax=Protomyces lactucae-debilis TaxID=2754530 RepID=A0A1Y2FM95_PROLT|nr:WD40-repeat-containing domain protein [Protomyces lactucae-debilis]ORY85101.1 WD40-repeat-containing domain protein [Protomyces lactucae-debilis]
MLKLSRSYAGHTQDVRGVAASGDSLYSCSRDGTVREWGLKASNTQLTQHALHNGFVNSIATDGRLIISGGQDSIIYVVEQGQTEPMYTLVGHTSNVCALAVGPDGLIISGSWDGTVRLWKSGVCLETYEGHQGAVWAVLYTPHGILTGGADRTIRLWKDGKQIKNLPAGKDCVRALALHPAGFVSAGNDATIRLHSFEGDVVQQLEGHESFIYSLAVTDGGDIYSVGEDGTLRHWKDGQQAQSIKHPAVSVWCVTRLSNGDIATGTSDGVVRVFTAATERFAAKDEQTAFDESVAASQNPAQTTNIPNNLPGLEALSTPGRKEGEIKMIRLPGGIVEAHQWSGGVWTKVGEVMGATPQRVGYKGQEYDFVFDVDIAEGVPPLKLPYNTDQNPYEAAQKFIDKYELDAGFLQQIVKFIETNTGGIPLGVPKQEDTAKKESVPVAQQEYLAMVSGNAASILKKLESFCTEMQIEVLTTFEPSSPSNEQMASLLRIAKKLPREKRFPALDLIRLAVPHATNLTASFIMDVLEFAEITSGVSTKDKTRETNAMLAYRTLANTYVSDVATKAVDAIEARATDAISGGLSWPDNRNTTLAQITYLLNVSVYSRKHDRADIAMGALESLLLLLSEASDEEVHYRGLVALSTAIQCAEEVSITAKEVYEADKILAEMRRKVGNASRLTDVLDGLDKLLQDAPKQ